MSAPLARGAECAQARWVVGATRFERATSSSQSWRSTRLSYAPVEFPRETGLYMANQPTKVK